MKGGNIVFYHFLNNLFYITIELDGSLNGLSSYTIDVQYREGSKYVVKYLRSREVIK